MNAEMIITKRSNIFKIKLFYTCTFSLHISLHTYYNVSNRFSKIIVNKSNCNRIDLFKSILPAII